MIKLLFFIFVIICPGFAIADHLIVFKSGVDCDFFGTFIDGLRVENDLAGEGISLKGLTSGNVLQITCIKSDSDKTLESELGEPIVIPSPPIVDRIEYRVIITP